MYSLCDYLLLLAMPKTLRDKHNTVFWITGRSKKKKRRHFQLFTLPPLVICVKASVTAVTDTAGLTAKEDGGLEPRLDFHATKSDQCVSLSDTCTLADIKTTL